MEYVFSNDEYYASFFGLNIKKYKIFTGKVLNLKKYNKIIRDELYEKNYDIYGEYFIIHSERIQSKFDRSLELLYHDMPELADKFEKEFESCDSVYGSDTGFSSSDVWYIKDKNNIIEINDIQQ